MNVAITLVFLFFTFLLLLIIALLILFFFVCCRKKEEPTKRQELIPEEYGPPAPHPDYPPEEFYVQNQLIVTAPAALAESLPDKLKEKEVTLTKLELLDLGGLISEPCSHLQNDLVIVKYEISGKRSSVFEAIQILDEVLGDEAGVVIKEPNWITGQPFEVEGAPFEVEGAPFEVEGAAGGFLANDIKQNEFIQQWAFEMIGGPATLGKTEYTGEGVLVAAFDSAPYPAQGNQTNQYLHKTVNLPGGRASMDLEFRRVFSPNKPGEVPQDDPVSNAIRAQMNSGIRNHGLFVLGLIHAIAPQSSLYLYRVLDHENRGNLFLLIKGIYLFLKEIVANEKQAKTGAVINMSLVVRTPPGEANFGLTTDLLSLNTVLEVANCLGVVAVSAAGNSSGRARIPHPASHPGGMSGVIPVAANNQEMNRSCFSNCGDVSAPGGDGRPLGEDDQECKPRQSECVDAACRAAVIGPAIPPPYDYGPGKDPLYVLWSGTSFAAPLVSGLAALVVQVGGGAFDPARVKKIIQCSAIGRPEYALGAGVIQIPAALAAGKRERGGAAS